MMADIRRNQGRLQEAHERSKTVTRSEEMKKLREQMQVGAAAVGSAPCALLCGCGALGLTAQKDGATRRLWLLGESWLLGPVLYPAASRRQQTV